MAKSGRNSVTMLLLVLLLDSFFSSSLASIRRAAEIISRDQALKDGDFLVSADKTFDLGFFSPENSTYRYVGIKYHKMPNQTIVWVANRDRPIYDKKGFLTIGEDGNLQIIDGDGVLVWSSNASIASSLETVAMLEETGNLILSSNGSVGDIYNAFWQSFSLPTDTYLPNMKVLIQGENHAFTSWKSPNDPSPGRFSAGVDARGSPQIVIWEQSRRVWRSGHWDGQIFTGLPIMLSSTTYQYGFKVSFEDANSYLTYNPFNTSDLTSWHISYSGFEEQLRWNEKDNNWIKLLCEPGDECEHFNYCGNFGICNSGKIPKCRCPKGFRPRDREQWNRGNFSGGCERSSPLQCQNSINSTHGQDDGPDGFLGMEWLKLPDFVDNVDVSASLESCRDKCLSNCSCNAYAKITGIGCMIWSGDLADIRQFYKAGNSMYLRLPATELNVKGLTTPVIVGHVVAGVIFLTIVIWVVRALTKRYTVVPLATSASRSRKSEKSLSELSWTKDLSTELPGPAKFLIEGNSVSGRELKLFNFVTIAAATNNFSEENRLGQGGFGHVYRGKIPGGQEIAVKRLSRVSGQGLEEFKNEVILIARLQHRNLVRLLGCCIEGEEKILLYEFMPNRSLDSFIFDPMKRALLDWKKRFTIIEGIARGLVYLHRDSRLRVIHRDLKAGNILLDEEMNAKISDFGMARIFGGNQNEANTNRVVGTFGYMSPEYAMGGLFSVKSDVYSFGVLLLEIVSGQKNTRFQSTDHKNLITYAWELWNEEKVMEIVDPSIRDACEANEVLRCIQVGMLCVQDSACHRPSMDSVVVMLETENASLPLPRKPTFTSMRSSIDAKVAEVQETASSNNLTVTMVAGR